MTCFGDYLLLAIDGTGIYSSAEYRLRLLFDQREAQRHIEYHLQMVTGALVAPDCNEVLPFCPEPIRRQDGSTKNDCERNATRCFLPISAVSIRT
ncbi:MAG: hypothetical protein RBT36_04495 [Desulfobulbus sp.]|jgi:hypothetical protein|nr:hypothetical protein [Desulfobulbus sp.]